MQNGFWPTHVEVTKVRVPVPGSASAFAQIDPLNVEYVEKPVAAGGVIAMHDDADAHDTWTVRPSWPSDVGWLQFAPFHVNTLDASSPAAQKVVVGQDTDVRTEPVSSAASVTIELL